MKKELMDILQNEVVFDRLSGSSGNITAVNMGIKHYFREKGKPECLNTEHQQIHHRLYPRFRIILTQPYLYNAGVLQGKKIQTQC